MCALAGPLRQRLPNNLTASHQRKYLLKEARIPSLDWAIRENNLEMVELCLQAIAARGYQHVDADSLIRRRMSLPSIAETENKTDWARFFVTKALQQYYWRANEVSCSGFIEFLWQVGEVTAPNLKSCRVRAGRGGRIVKFQRSIISVRRTGGARY